MSGFEIFGALVASIDLVKAIHGGLGFLNEVRQGPKLADGQRQLYFQLFVQAIRFERWCDDVGASKVLALKKKLPNDWQRRKEVVQFRETLTSELRLTNFAVAKLTLEILKDIEAKFKAAWIIIQKYQSHFSEENHSTTSFESQKPKKSRWSSMLRSASSSDVLAKAPSFESDNVGFKLSYSAVKWVGMDKKEFTGLLGDITSLNTSLLTLLDPEKQQRVQRQVTMAILTIATPESAPQFSGDNDLRALAKIKAMHDPKGDRQPGRVEDPNPPKVEVYHMNDLKGLSANPGDVRSIGHIFEESVMVEWKVYSKEKPIRVERMVQLSNLAGLLNHQGLFERFRAPRFRGLLNDESNCRIGIIFSRPSPDASERKPLECLDLQSLIRSSLTTAPPVGERFKIAKQLALAMFHLHSVHWLHKSFRSDNVVFFDAVEQGATSANRTPTAASHSLARQNSSISDMTQSLMLSSSELLRLPRSYVVGWDVSRPDGPTEFSESLSRPSAASPKRPDNVELYSHPETTSISGIRVRYRKEFDIYSLGLVLLEIGLWRPLDSIRKKYDSDEEFRTALSGEYCDRLLPKMGAIYWGATRRCLKNDFGLGSTDGNEPEEYSLQVAFEKHVVGALEKCFA